MLGRPRGQRPRGLPAYFSERQHRYTSDRGRERVPVQAWKKDRLVEGLRLTAGAACLPAICLAAYLSLPLLGPALEQAALLSAVLSFPAEEDTLPEPEEQEAPSAPAELEDAEVMAPPPSYDYLEKLTPVEKEAPAAPIEVPVKPENAGSIQRRTYTTGNGSAYIPLEAGYIKNCTTLDTASILEAVAQRPAFAIQGDGAPEVLIMHTHATESYQAMALDWYDKADSARTTDLTKNTCAVGEVIARQLEAGGIGVLHDTTLHDYPSYTGAYERSAATVKAYLEKYPSIKVVLDVHRDAIQTDSSTMVAPVTSIGGKSCAQVMIISGCDDGRFNMPNYMENLKFSAALQAQIETDYPTLTRPILFDYRKYNQDLTTGSILLEVGGHANTLEEALNCGEFVGKSLAKVLLALKE